MSLPEPLQNVAEKYQRQLPVGIVEMARDLSIEMYHTDGLKKGQSGSIAYEDGGYVIYVNVNETPARKRFTIAHELGHWALHQDFLKQQGELIDSAKQTTDGALYRAPGETPGGQKRENEANQIAAELLMPAEQFRRIYEQADSIEEVADRFGVSASAASVRAKTLLNSFMM